MTNLSDNICPKCSGRMFINEDNDLNCFMCGKIIVLTVRREYDSRTGKSRDNKKKGLGGDLDGDIEMDGRGIWGNGTPYNHSEMVRQRGLKKRRGRPRRTLGVPRG